jgi:hypothetical protein
MGVLLDLRVFLVKFTGYLLCYNPTDLLLAAFRSTVFFVEFLVFLFTMIGIMNRVTR